MSNIAANMRARGCNATARGSNDADTSGCDATDRRTKDRAALTWASLAETIRASPAWATAALLGQMTLERADAEVIAAKLGLPAEASLVLQQPPSRGSLDTAVPTDPLIYRFYELVQVYGTTFKALIHEEFGDGIMSAIDFDMQIERQPDPKGDRVRIVMSGKFLPYKRY